MDMYTATCRDHDPIIGESEYLKRRGLCTENAVWRLIGRIVALYVNDPRFTAYYDKIMPGCAHFLRDAVDCWAK